MPTTRWQSPSFDAVLVPHIGPLEFAVAFLPSRYDPWVVVTSFLIAAFASYVALDLAKRVRTQEQGVAQAWWAFGSLAMGTGIWCMHFVGMLALSLPIAIGFDHLATLASWVAAVLVSAVALYVASRGTLRWHRLALGSLAMGAGICAMHYIGMASLDMSPAIVWDPLLIAISAAIAVGASAAALTIFFWLRSVHSRHGVLYQVVAALIMGAAISGMHYTGMAAARFPVGTVCLSAGALGGDSLGALLTLASIGMLATTLLTSTLDARMQSRTALLAGSLEQANAQLHAANEELRQQAFLDPLTSLPNRSLFEDRLAHAARRSERAQLQPSGQGGERLAVLFVDLDGFKPINDSLGHSAGDQILRQAAARLLLGARKSDTLARIGGDEFVLLMEGAVDQNDCVAVARRLVEVLATPFEVAGRQVQISGSVGVAVFPDHGQADKLVSHADAAMYAAKRAGGNTFALFAAHMDAGAAEQLSLQNDLRHAIELGQLQLHYQPKIAGVSGQIRGVEALLRWSHPQRGMVSPEVFVAIAERFGMINSLGDWVIDEACRQIEEWADAGIRMRVAINLSVHQLRGDLLVEQLQAALARHHVEASQLLCEITESAAMEDIKATQGAFDGLARMGVFLSIDDFGTGYSSLSYLRQLPAKQLKIDRSFVREHGEDARAIVDAVINLAHSLGLTVVAEGVETAGQRNILLALGCDELQGYFFARPMPPQALTAWIMGYKPDDAPDFSPSVMQSLDAA
jgi:diguanylate cyclase (GGDEF)-like protein